ncbi:MAG TPA: FAD-binding domain-containing protein [Gaiellaceae bacterium]|nr:FAD-binding domain-containing protein [Gaiellaceae bacterium]
MKTYAGFRRAWGPSREGVRHEAIEEFVETRLAGYADDRDFPARDATSRLSPLIASGEITVVDCTAAALAAPPSKGREKWLDELCWHDWFEHVKSSGLDAPRLEPRWDPPGERFERWRDGTTGFPLVDAGMRELAQTGWMHNRARMVTASFLVKHLHVDWRAGEAWFAERLVDYDPAQNEGNWQWVAGTGIDAQPWFRILNPERQRERFDADGAYCRGRLPEWGTDAYPEPMLDLAAEAAEAKERFRAASR